MSRSHDLQVGDLVLRYIQKVQRKVLCWKGPYFQNPEKIGMFMKISDAVSGGIDNVK